MEVGHVHCELLAYTLPAETAAASGADLEARTRERAEGVKRARMERHSEQAKPVSSEAIGWVQALVLMLVGYAVSYLAGWATP